MKELKNCPHSGHRHDRFVTLILRPRQRGKDSWQFMEKKDENIEKGPKKLICIVTQ